MKENENSDSSDEPRKVATKRLTNLLNSIAANQKEE